MKILFHILLFILLTSCVSKSSKSSDVLVSMQLVDRNGFSETISSKERLSYFASTDFSLPQPYKKVLRVFARDNQGRSASRISSYHDNGHIWQYLEVVDGRAQGFYREWHANGKMKIEASVIEGMADISERAQASWLFDNKSQVWNEKGNLVAEFFYDKGMLEGASQYYFSNGQLEKKIPYFHNELHGEVLIYSEKGSLIEKTRYVRGKKAGLSERFFKNGVLCFREAYDDGLLKKGSYYNPQGEQLSQVHDGSGLVAYFQDNTLHSFTEYHDGVIDGKVSIFYPDGNLRTTYYLQEGKKNGEECEYYPVKMTSEILRPKLALTWHDDVLQGITKSWYENGTLESQRELDKNKKNGLSFAWYRDGSLMFMEEYDFDQLLKGSYFQKGEKNPISTIEGGNGVATLYTREGFFSKKIPYEKGKPVTHE
jgi:antitoxin component YwqK of YwqJK toxin-antitoxin module